MSLKKEITYYYTDGLEKQTCKPIIDEAESRGYSTIITENLHQNSEIGLYCQHRCYPEHAKFSIVMLHDMAQGHNRWPNFWMNEPWNKFDIGILPGPSWLERWNGCKTLPYVKPREGVYTCGWPKADLIFKDQAEFCKKVDELKNNLGLIHDKSILYAPSWENDGKQNDVVQAFKDLPVNILLKQAPYQTYTKNGWNSFYTGMIKAIEEMNKLHRNFKPNVYIIDPEISIMYCIGIADVLVSDESSVMVESLLLDVPSIAVMDWLVPDTVPSRYPIVPFDFAIKTLKKTLYPVVCEVLNNSESHQRRLRKLRDHHFVNLGNASASIVDVIDKFIETHKSEYQNNSNNIHDLLSFTESVVSMVESGKLNEALSFYTKHRKMFPMIKELEQYDKLMETLRQKIQTEV